MPDLNLEIEVKIKQVLPDGTEKEHTVSGISIDSMIAWLGSMERMMLREAAEQEIATSLEDKEKDGCTCGMKGKCCENPRIITPSHQCSDEAVCEDCYVLECLNCSKSCSHEL